MLSDALRSHRSALAASLWAVYGLRLATVREVMGPQELADLTAELPAGCAFWQSVGGPLSWSPEMHLLAQIDHGIRAMAWQQHGKGNRPKPLQPPPYAGALRAEEARMAEKAARWKAAHGG